MRGRRLLIGMALMLALGVAGLTQHVDDEFGAIQESSSDEMAVEDPYAEDSITDPMAVDPDFADDTPPPSASRTGLSRPLTPLRPGRADDTAPMEAPAELLVASLPDETGRNLWRITPLFGTGVTYDDNIFISHTNRVADVIWSIRGGLAFELGDFRDLEDNFLVARWEGLGLLYTNNPSQNAFNQDAGLLGQYHWQKLTGRVESRYQYLTTPDRLLGTATERQIFLNAIYFEYDLSDKTKLDAEFSQSAQLYQSFLDQYEYRGKLGIKYQILPRVNLGVESALGYLNVQDSPGQIYQQLRLRTRYQLTGKIMFKMSAGVELREFSDGEPLRVNPVFSMGLEYRPFDGTSIALEGYRNIYGSAVKASQDYAATGFVLTINQRFLQRVTAMVAIGFENDSYFGTSTSTETSRVDNYFFVRSSVAYSLTKYAVLQLFYEFQNNDSNQLSNAFYDNRVGGSAVFKL